MDTLTGVDRPAEPDGFRAFVEARSPALLRSGWLLTGDWTTAEDLVQTALAAAWPRWDSLRRQDAPEVYVRKIMINTYLRWRQRRWNGEIATGRLPEMAAYGDVFAQIDARHRRRRQGDDEAVGDPASLGYIAVHEILPQRVRSTGEVAEEKVTIVVSHGGRVAKVQSLVVV